ncbi:uncharacterized protein LOC126897587 [Daktulosphaira vitifoliae]|uniref:uncharacterized protein LOC126897587 n=1 Tax=Daktulosphaira vitifoliae TaxID=58002 RepID=UPI0021AA544A|nr:uncharacterized protein LOC126897587 [Daktulosphaira vitifoliae]
MVQKRTKVLQVGFLCLYTIQLLFTQNTADEISSKTGAEFLHNIISNLHRSPHHKHKLTRPTIVTAKDRIDVEEYIPGDFQQSNPRVEDLNILSKIPQNINSYLPKDTNPIVSESQVLPYNTLQTFPQQQLLQNDEASLQNGLSFQQGAVPLQINQFPQANNEFTSNLVQSLTAGNGAQQEGTVPGYYYYFVPLNKDNPNALLNQGDQFQANQNFNSNPNDLQQLFQDTQQSQVSKPFVDPLFKAMAGFVGVAVVFLSAMIFIPHFGPLLHKKSVLKRAPEEIATITKLVAESIDGKDCSERIACEVGRAMRSLQVGPKPIKLMEIMLPPGIAKQLAQIRRSSLKKEECHFITCKKTDNIIKLVAKLKNTNYSSNKLLKLS